MNTENTLKSNLHGCTERQCFSLDLNEVLETVDGLQILKDPGGQHGFGEQQLLVSGLCIVLYDPWCRQVEPR